MPKISANDLKVNEPIEAPAPDATLILVVDPNKPLKVGAYTFQLEVLDDSGNLSSRHVTVKSDVSGEYITGLVAGNLYSRLNDTSSLTILGGGGNDILSGGGGTDTIWASVSVNLNDNAYVENLRLSGP